MACYEVVPRILLLVAVVVSRVTTATSGSKLWGAVVNCTSSVSGAIFDASLRVIVTASAPVAKRSLWKCNSYVPVVAYLF